MTEVILTCTFIIGARILDVSFGTLRIIFVGKGKSSLSFIFSFLEVFIWFMVARNVLSGDSPLWYAFPYSIGYAMGTYIGSYINEKFVGGTLGVQVITTTQNQEILEAIRKNGYALSAIRVEGRDEDKYMLFMEINKKRFDSLEKLIKSLDQNAFIVVNETRYVQNGYFK